MNKEKFIKKIKEINATVPNEYFFLEYNKCVCDILEENQQLKGSLETYEILLKANFKENKQLKGQQKEFIEWLEGKLSNELGIFTEIRVCDVLSKYKEIIGVK